MENTVFQNNIHLHNGLMAYWPLDGNSADAIGNNDGTDTTVSYVSGKLNNAASFNGSTSIINTAYNFNASTGSFHFIFKANSINPSSVYRMVGNYLGYAYIEINQYGNIFYAFLGTTALASYSTPASVDTWTFVGMTWDNGIVKFYKDGVLVYTHGSNVGNLGGGTYVSIGNYPGANFALDGLIDEVAIWNRALSEQEIKRLFNGGRAFSLISKTGGIAPEPPPPEGPIYGIINQTGLVLDLHSGDPDSYPGTGTSWFDKSPAASAASVISGSPAYTNGADPNKYFTLTGSPHFVTTPINIQGATNANLQTIGAWHKGMTTNQVYFGTNAASSGQSHLCVRVASATTIRFEGSYYGGGTGESVVTSGTLTPNASGWNYVVAVKTASSLYDIYYNGVRVLQNIMRNSTGSVAFICLGKVYNTFIGPSVHGALHIYNRALTSQEVLDNYNAQLPYYSL